MQFSRKETQNRQFLTPIVKNGSISTKFSGLAKLKQALQYAMLSQIFYHYFLFIAIIFWVPISSASERFVPLDEQGNPITRSADNAADSTIEWPCVLDRKTGLIWEVKSRNPGLHHRHNTYSWFNPNPEQNGGLAGQPGGAECRARPCDTNAFINISNKTGWCNAHDWRLPTREELRSLVNYATIYPGPTLDTKAFPDAVAQFFWSANPGSKNPDEAWGIGFAFGFDYTYYKSNQVHVRLVREQRSRELTRTN